MTAIENVKATRESGLNSGDYDDAKLNYVFAHVLQSIHRINAMLLAQNGLADILEVMK
jgi:hypothetical protein